MCKSSSVYIILGKALYLNGQLMIAGYHIDYISELKIGFIRLRLGSKYGIYPSQPFVKLLVSK